MYFLLTFPLCLRSTLGFQEINLSCRSMCLVRSVTEVQAFRLLIALNMIYGSTVNCKCAVWGQNWGQSSRVVVMNLKDWSFSQMEQEFSKIRESDESLERELGSVQRPCLLHVSCWHCGSILVSNPKDDRFEPF